MLVPTDPLVYSLANNGWIWDADPLQNFALLPPKAYLRRKVRAIVSNFDMAQSFQITPGYGLI